MIYLIIWLLAFSPLFPILIWELFKIKGSEANDIIGTLPWAVFFTVPIGLLATLITAYMQFKGLI